MEIKKTPEKQLKTKHFLMALYILVMGLLVSGLLLYKALRTEELNIAGQETVPSPVPTAIPATSHPVSIHGLESISFEVLASNAAPGEQIFYRFSVTNGQPEPLSLGYVGVVVLNSAGTNVQFRTSWANRVLEPNQTQSWSDSLIIDSPGEYQLQLTACFPTIDACDTDGGEWEDLAPPAVIAIIQ